MKIISALLLTFVLISAQSESETTDETNHSNKNNEKSKEMTLYDFKVKDINGDELDLSKFKGKKILIVNTASKCGFTPQYEGLEELYNKKKDELVIIGFPANNFGGQEPGSNDEIAAFCKKNYGVSFPMAAKVSVKGDDQHKLFQWLTSQENEDFTGDISWNFEKFLINKEGHLVRRFKSMVKPTSNKMMEAIDAL